MPTVTTLDVAAGLRTRWAAVSALVAVVPVARVFVGRTGEKISGTITQPPYARLNITEGEPELFSGPAYVQDFDVMVEVYLTDETTPNTLRSNLDAAFHGGSTTPTAGITVSNATVLHSMARGGGNVKPTNERINGKDVLRVTANYRLKLEGNRG
jgi:hypothetical protein